MKILTKMLLYLLIVAMLFSLIGCADPQATKPSTATPATSGLFDGNIDLNLHGVWVTADGTVQNEQDGVDFSICGTLPTEYDLYSNVEMKLNFIWPDNFTYPNEGTQTYAGGANPADKHENQSIYHGGKYVYSPELHDSIFLSYTICPEEGFAVIHVGDRYLVASTDPSADPVEIFAFYQEYVHVNQ